MIKHNYILIHGAFTFLYLETSIENKTCTITPKLIVKPITVRGTFAMTSIGDAFLYRKTSPG